MLIHLVGLLIFIYIFIRLIRPLPLRWWFKLSYAGIALLATQVHFIQRFLVGGMAAPELPGWVVMSMGWAFASMMLLACSLILRDILLALSYTFNKGEGLRRAVLSPLNSSFMLMFSTFICAVGVWRAVSFPTVTHIELEFDKLPPAFDGYRIVHLSDLHTSRLLPESWLEEVLRASSFLNPDLIVMTGDLIDGSPEHRHRDIRSFKLLRAPDGVWASLGNHEYYSGLTDWLSAFKSIDLPVLHNENIRIVRGTEQIVLAAVTDPVAARYGKELPDIDKALADTQEDDMIILMSHRPIDTQKHANKGVSLQLSGHTHGGQIIGINLLTKLANKGFLKGLYAIDDMYLYLNRGAGLWGGLPVRIGVESEIAEITLRAAKAKIEAGTGSAPTSKN
ncbi:MAG: metallophosphoesterase [Alcaligenaceae bacterium]|nr:metallophosphoesterase [Alcaligenaceae bacterium]